MSDDDLLLVAWLDGELDGEASTRIEARITEDATLRARVDEIRALTASLRESLPEAPTVLDPAHRGALMGAAFDAFTVRPQRHWILTWRSVAACLIAAVLIGMLIPGVSPILVKSRYEYDEAPIQVTSMPAPAAGETWTMDRDDQVRSRSDLGPVGGKEGLELRFRSIDELNDLEDFHREETSEFASGSSHSGSGVNEDGSLFVLSIGASDGRTGTSGKQGNRQKDKEEGQGLLPKPSERESGKAAQESLRGGRADENKDQAGATQNHPAAPAAEPVPAPTTPTRQEERIAKRERSERKQAEDLQQAQQLEEDRRSTSGTQTFTGWTSDLALADLGRKPDTLAQAAEMAFGSNGISISNVLDLARDQDQMQALQQAQELDDGEPTVPESLYERALDGDLTPGRILLESARAAGLHLRLDGGEATVVAQRRALDITDSHGLDRDTFRAAFGTAPMQDIARQPAMTVSMTDDTASFAITEQRLNDGFEIDPDQVQAEHFVNAVPTDYPPPAGDEAFALYAEAGPSPFAAGPAAERTRLVSIGAVARPVSSAERRPLALTLAVDRSGSMAGAAGIARIRAGLAELVPRLQAKDRISIVAFADRAEVVLPPTPGDQGAAILAAVDSLQAGGSTNAIEGLALAYQVALESVADGVESRVCFATDGAALGGDSAQVVLDRLAGARQRGVSLLILGCGGADAQDQALETLARQGDGQLVHAGSDDAARALFRDRLVPERLALLARDAKLQVTWNPQRVSHARLIGFEQRRLRDEDFRNDTVDAGEVSHDSQVTALFEVVLAADGSGPLGTAAVRYRDTRVDRVIELGCPLPGSLATGTASTRLELQACAAALAELLQRSWWANQRCASYAAVAERLQRLPASVIRDRLLHLTDLARASTGEP